MPVIVEEVSKITAKGQTTVPKSVRQALGVDVGGRIAFAVGSEGVTVRRADAVGEDPAIGSFLAFLARDIQRRPEGVTALNPDLASRLAELAGEGEVDPQEPIEGDVALR